LGSDAAQFDLAVLSHRFRRLGLQDWIGVFADEFVIVKATSN
jgi:hypothetical protein